MSFDSINKLKELTTKHSEVLNNILTSLDTGLPTRLPTGLDTRLPTIKELEKFIIYKKYYPGDTSSQMENKTFYDNIITKLGTSANDTVFYLTNGAHVTLTSGHGGTNAAITTISPDFFNITDDTCIYSSKDKIEKTDLNNHINSQIIQSDFISNNNKYPGSTFYVRNHVRNIEGVYHIKGWNHNYINVEDNINYKRLVTAYYIAILDHFTNNIENKKDKMSILHLVQCPGHLFGAKEKTTEIFINTLYCYLIENRERLNKLNFRISVDYEYDNNFQYDYELYKSLK
jgi:hypothetical protein